MDNFVFGRYIPGNSFAHRLNPVTKLLVSFIFVLVVVFANNPLSYLSLILLMIVSIICCRTKLRFIIQGIKPLLWVILFTVIIQLLFTNSGNVYFQVGWLSITSNGVEIAFFIAMRFFLIIIVSTLFTLTTSPLEISYAIERVLTPLKKLNVPVDTLGMMISIALRFVPTLTDDMNTIINAQKSRGMDFNSGNIFRRVKKFIPILIPLFISSFKHAEDLAMAMEARGYQNGVKRTRYRQYHFSKSDWMTIIIFMLVAFAVLLLRSR